MTELPPGDGGPPAPQPPATRRGGWARVQAGCLGFALFYVIAIALVIAIANRGVTGTAGQVAIVTLVGLGFAARRLPRELWAALAVGFGVGLVLFGGCLATLKVGG